MKKILLFSWYMLGCLCTLPAIGFILLSRWIGVKAEDNALRELTKEDVKIDGV